MSNMFGIMMSSIFGIMIDTVNRICYIGNSLRRDSCPISVFQKVFYSIFKVLFSYIFQRTRKE